MASTPEEIRSARLLRGREKFLALRAAKRSAAAAAAAAAGPPPNLRRAAGAPFPPLRATASLGTVAGAGKPAAAPSGDASPPPPGPRRASAPQSGHERESFTPPAPAGRASLPDTPALEPCPSSPSFGAAAPVVLAQSAPPLPPEHAADRLPLRAQDPPDNAGDAVREPATKDKVGGPLETASAETAANAPACAGRDDEDPSKAPSCPVQALNAGEGRATADLRETEEAAAGEPEIATPAPAERDKDFDAAEEIPANPSEFPQDGSAEASPDPVPARSEDDVRANAIPRQPARSSRSPSPASAVASSFPSKAAAEAQAEPEGGREQSDFRVARPLTAGNEKPSLQLRGQESENDAASGLNQPPSNTPPSAESDRLSMQKFVTSDDWVDGPADGRPDEAAGAMVSAANAAVRVVPQQSEVMKETAHGAESGTGVATLPGDGSGPASPVLAENRSTDEQGLVRNTETDPLPPQNSPDEIGEPVERRLQSSARAPNTTSASERTPARNAGRENGTSKVRLPNTAQKTTGPSSHAAGRSSAHRKSTASVAFGDSEASASFPLAGRSRPPRSTPATLTPATLPNGQIGPKTATAKSPSGPASRAAAAPIRRASAPSLTNRQKLNATPPSAAPGAVAPAGSPSTGPHGTAASAPARRRSPETTAAAAASPAGAKNSFARSSSLPSLARPSLAGLPSTSPHGTAASAPARRRSAETTAVAASPAGAKGGLTRSPSLPSPAKPNLAGLPSASPRGTAASAPARQRSAGTIAVAASTGGARGGFTRSPSLPSLAKPDFAGVPSTGPRVTAAFAPARPRSADKAAAAVSMPGARGGVTSSPSVSSPVKPNFAGSTGESAAGEGAQPRSAPFLSPSKIPIKKSASFPSLSEGSHARQKSIAAVGLEKENEELKRRVEELEACSGAEGDAARQKSAATAGLEKENEELKRRVEELEACSRGEGEAALRRRLAELEQEVKELREDKEETHEICDILEREASAAIHKVYELQSKLRVKDGIIKKLQAENVEEVRSTIRSFRSALHAPFADRAGGSLGAKSPAGRAATAAEAAERVQPTARRFGSGPQTPFARASGVPAASEPGGGPHVAPGPAGTPFLREEESFDYDCACSQVVRSFWREAAAPPTSEEDGWASLQLSPSSW